MIELRRTRLETLRDELKRRGQRRSLLLPTAAPNIIQALEIVEEYGPMCEALYLVMAADRRVLNVEREVLRGALDVLSEGRVRTLHMEAMLDAAARRAAEDGASTRLDAVIETLRDDPVRAETTVLLAAAVALADGQLADEELQVFNRLARGFNMDEGRANRLLEELTRELVKQPEQPPVT
jgi:tellurite resistance protein